MKIKELVKRKEIIFIISLIVIIFCFLIDGFAIYKSTTYTESAKENRGLQNKFKDLSNYMGTSVVKTATEAIYAEELSIDMYLRWMDTKDIEYFENSTSRLELSTTILNLSSSYIYTEWEYINETAKYEKLANENDSKSSKINMGLLLMNMAIFLLSLSIIPLRMGLEEKEKKYYIFKHFGLIIFIMGSSMWMLGFIPIFSLMF